jgi:hypothetical protein
MELSLQKYADSFEYLTQPNYSFTRNNMRNNDYFNDKKGDEADFAFLREQIYAGFLGMNIGIRLGAPVEPEVWTSERIRHYFMGMSLSMLKIFICLRLMMIPTGLTFFLELCTTKKPQSHATGCS